MMKSVDMKKLASNPGRNIKKMSSVNCSLNLEEVSPHVVKDIELTIDPRNQLGGKNKCLCDLCMSDKFDSNPNDKNIFKSNSQEASKWLKKILDGLTLSGAKTLRLYLPDILFVDGQSLEIYQTSRKQGRIIKIPGATPLKTLQHTFMRLRKQYKTILQENYNLQMLDKVNPEFLHLKYFDKLIPSYFNDSNNSITLESNKHHFKRYVLHKNQKYEIPQIQEHKMNEKELFCLVKYRDGNCQLLNQLQFQIFSISNLPKIQQQVSFFQSYIKYKLEASSILFSEYTYKHTILHDELDKKAEKQIIILLGGMNRYDEQYKDIETLQQFAVDLMLSDHQEYVNFMTYKIIHYLAMASRIYVSHVKFKWILNDIGTIYLQQVLEMEFDQFPHRIIKYRLPIKDDSLDFYNQSSNFVDIYKDMKRRKAINTLIIKRDLDSKTYNEIVEIMDSPSKRQQNSKKNIDEIKENGLPLVARKNRISISNSKTIDYSKTNRVSISPTMNTIEISRKKNRNYQQHLRNHPQIVMKNLKYDSNSLNRYNVIPKKILHVDKKINNHFLFNMSTEDHKIYDNQPINTQRNASSIEKSKIGQYLEAKHAKVSKSLLYNTFYELSAKKSIEINSLLQQQKITKKYQNLGNSKQ